MPVSLLDSRSFVNKRVYNCMVARKAENSGTVKQSSGVVVDCRPVQKTDCSIDSNTERSYKKIETT